MTTTIYSAPRSDPAEIELWRAIPVAIAVDLVRNDGQIDPAIRPLKPPGTQPFLFGRAVTAMCEPPDFGAVLHAAEIVGPGDVLVIAAAGNPDVAMIGEVLSGHLRRRGCVGVVCDGAIRDVAMLAGWSDFSVFTRFVTPRGPTSANRGTVNQSVIIGGRLVTPGDLIIGDDDGLVALSPDAVRTRIHEAQAKVTREADWMRSLSAGRSIAEIFGIDAPKLAS